MQSLQSKLHHIFASAFEQLGFPVETVAITVSQRPELSDYQCNSALRLAKQLGESPRDIALKIVEVAMEKDEQNVMLSAFVEGPGFVNIRVNNAALASGVSAASADARLGVAPALVTKKVTVDYGGLNVAKPMHVGHLRSLMIGESVKRVLRTLGHTVTADVHLGDWGTQMGMVIIEVEREQPDLPYFDESFEGEYPVEAPFTLDDLDKIYPRSSARCKENPEAMAAALKATRELQAGRRGYRALWQHIVNVSVETLKREVAFMGVDFELWNGESDYHEWCGKMIAQLQEQGFAQESEGALIIPFTPEDTPGKKKELPPLLLTKSDGAYLYGTSDLAAVDQRVSELGEEALVYVVDARQSLHFEQVFAAARKTGIAPLEVELTHAGFGTVNGVDGKPFKTRKGDAMKLWSLIELALDAAQKQMDAVNVAREYDAEEREEIARLVGLSALKFADLVNNRTTSYIFDIEKFTQFEGKTGPYLLYAAVRMQSILRKAEEAGMQFAPTVVNASDYGNESGQQAIRDLQLHLLQLPETLELVARDYTPHVLAEYVFELSQRFNRFYSECPILNEENAELQQSLLALVNATHKTLTFGLDLLGIEVPERM